MSRRLAREIVLQVLFELDMMKNESEAQTSLTRWAEEFAVPRKSILFAREVLDGVLKNRDDIDAKITAISQEWALDRMAGVDRNLLRLAAYEIIYRSDIPGRVSLNEAIELAKRFGGEESARFVNGILNRLVEDTGKTDKQTEKHKENQADFSGNEQEQHDMAEPIRLSLESSDNMDDSLRRDR